MLFLKRLSVKAKATVKPGNIFKKYDSLTGKNKLSFVPFKSK
jgi:hypothetical protein